MTISVIGKRGRCDSVTFIHAIGRIVDVKERAYGHTRYLLEFGNGMRAWVNAERVKVIIEGTVDISCS